jgi:hypothetical protein
MGGRIMASTINSSTSNGIVITPDTSGEIELQANGVTKAKVTANGLQDANGASLRGGSFRNLIINGDMNIAQRATSATASADNTYKTVDRWKTNFSSGAFTSEQYSMSSSELQTTGFSKAIKYACTTAVASPATTDFVMVRTVLEGQNLQHLQYGTSSAKTVTLSFWIKSNITGTYGVSLWKPDNTSSIIVDSITILSANTWEKKTVSFVGDTANGVINNDNGEGLRVSIALMLGTDRVTTAGSWMAYGGDFGVSGNANFMSSTSNTLYLTGVQLEVGSGASDFEFLPYDVQLARCQRYYFRNTNTGAYAGIGLGRAYSTTAGNSPYWLPVTMRASPTVSYSALTDFDLVPTVGSSGSGNPTVLRNDGAAGTNLDLGWERGSLTNSGVYLLEHNAGTANWIDFSAEL